MLIFQRIVYLPVFDMYTPVTETGNKETQSIPDGRLGTESDLSGDQGCVEKMEYADPELAAGNESFYYRVR